MIFRIDDVSQNTDMEELAAIVQIINDTYPGSEIWYCVNPICRSSFDGSVYPGVPFKGRDKLFFYNVNSVFSDERMWKLRTTGRIVSHGLLHSDHSKLQYDAQEMSIVTSCNLLATNTFVPPFNYFNEATESVCRINKIKLIRSEEEGWESLEYEKFDPTWGLWYFHPWRFNAESFKAALNGKISGQFQGHDASRP